MNKSILFLIAMLCTGIVNAQNVGVGTTTPGAQLDVNGTLKISDGTQGDGKILTSDAEGLASWQSPPPADEYGSIWICCESWMTKNLNVSTYRNGDTIPQVTSQSAWFASVNTGAYCYYNNDSVTYAAVYGKIYNWAAVADPRGLAPEGWHIPSNHEWTNLTTCLGGQPVAGGPSKETGTSHWGAPNVEATNITNFSALPGGYRTGVFSEIGTSGYWWSTTEYSTNSAAWAQFMIQNDYGFWSDGAPKYFGMYVRCVRD